MKEKNPKYLQLIDILASSWSSNEFSEEKVKITGFKKDDFVEVDFSEIDLVATLLSHEDPKVQINAVNILSLFGKNANKYVKEIAKLYGSFDEKERSTIVIALAVIGTLDALNALGSIIETQPSYDALFELLFHIVTFFHDFPIESIETILKSKDNSDLWSVIKYSFEKPLKTKDESEITLITPDFSDFDRTPIGISQEMEQKRIEKNAVLSSIEENMETIISLQKSDNKNKAKAATVLINKVKKLLKK